ncbi:MAG: glycosyltransferase family 39 protein [Bacteroidia bacterium]|nr:glycosyltransferase family 39 protein [Bacteroidia bacterium]
MKKTIILLLIVVISAILFFSFLGRVHPFDWDEINFAECAREMIVSGNYTMVQIDFLPFWEKPPLFIWMQVLSMKIWGINEFAARFPNALCGVITLAILFLIGSRVKSERMGILWVAAYVSSVLPFLYFKSGIIDPWFNLFIFLSIYALFEYTRSSGRWKEVGWSSLSATFLGLAILTKGPVAGIIWSLTFLVLLIIRRFRFPFHAGAIAGFVATLILIGGSWFFLIAFQGNTDTIVEFIQYQIRLFSSQDAGHGGSLLYYLEVLFLGLFPASMFFILSFWQKRSSDPNLSLLKKIMTILFFVVLILFSIVKTKIVHYTSLCYFPLTFLAALYIDSTWRQEQPLPKAASVIIVVIFSLFFLGTAAIPLSLNDPAWIFPYIKDPFAIACLHAPVTWTAFDYLPACVLFLGSLTYIFSFKREAKRQFLILGITSFLFIISAILVYPKKAEMYSQHALIEFCKSMKGKDVYLKSASFKSYAPLFYGDKQPISNPISRFNRWLMKGDVEKPVYLVTKVNKLEKLIKENPQLKIINQQNGYVLLIRE